MLIALSNQGIYSATLMNVPKNSMPITMQELADIAGVTRGTISRALSDSPRVNAETKARIHALAKQHNYRVNQKARNFRLGRTGVISLVAQCYQHSPY